MTDQNWTTVTTRGGIVRKEKRPYEECPNCGRHKLTTFKRSDWKSSLILDIIFRRESEPNVSKWKKCKNCKYTEDL